MRVLFWMFNCILELFLAQHVNVRVVQSVTVASIQNADQIINPLTFIST